MRHIEEKIALGSIRTYHILLLDFIENLDLKTNSYNSNYICGMLWNFVDSLWNQFAWMISFHDPKTEKFPQNWEISENVLPFSLFLFIGFYFEFKNFHKRGLLWNHFPWTTFDDCYAKKWCQCQIPVLKYQFSFFKTAQKGAQTTIRGLVVKNIVVVVVVVLLLL